MVQGIAPTVLYFMWIPVEGSLIELVIIVKNS